MNKEQRVSLQDYFKAFSRIEGSLLLYRASENGFATSTFHKLCDKSGPTLTLIRNDEEKTFGGFTFAEWDETNNYKEDDQAFLFSIDKR